MAEWVTGEGRYALLEPCRVLTIQLHPSRHEALMARTLIDENGCGDNCGGVHNIVDMAEG